MLSDWTRPLEVERLADGGEVREFDLPFSDLPRLADTLISIAGAAQCHLAFSRQRRFPVADITVHAQLPLRCQRCMRAMLFPVHCVSRVWLVSEAAAADTLEAGVEPVLAPDGRVVMRDLVEEELLLAVPLVPRHENAAECGVFDDSESDAVDEGSQTPFAGLGELLKRNQ